MLRRSESRRSSLSRLSQPLRGVFSSAELSVGLTTEGIDIHSVGNTLVLHQTALVEAFNLKAAIEYQRKNRKRALGSCEGSVFCNIPGTGLKMFILSSPVDDIYFGMQ